MDKTYKRVKVSLTFYYDPETYLYEGSDESPSDDEIFARCKEMFIEDITDYQNPLTLDIPKAEFIEDDDPMFRKILSWGS